MLVSQDRELEASFRDAFLNKRLGDCWRKGCNWAITDLNGVQMSQELCIHFDEQYSKVSVC